MRRDPETLADEVSREEGREIFRNACRRELGEEPEGFLAALDAGLIDVDHPDLHGRYMSVIMLRPFWDA